jgi:hypothetical protein
MALGTRRCSACSRRRGSGARVARTIQQPNGCLPAGFLLAGLTGWLGAELVEHHRIGIQDDAREDAPSSLPFSDDAPTLPGVRAERAAERMPASK